ncbi:DNA-binding transcriptional regulator, LacI/PurR family [Paracoccus seriniphilus]|uniref:DNA-binding transcriptional regulator, LacI/PurR family n=1 Tax=Paracoccus seriniphilus TaxID=184748 RepID=A0A239Q231_9RHOB|nr:DNA-binding transcriptional regulator, LacI/PurR family [Paracoccus seriniphilus]
MLSRLQDALSEHDVDTIQITYSETEHGLYMLRSMPSVDVAIVQCHFEPVAIELLSLLRRKAKSVLFDGATVSGLDVDAVASNWRVSLDMCMRHLIERGHRNIGMIGSTGRSRPIEAIRLHYESLRAWSPGGAVLHDPVWLDSLPNEDNLGEIGEALDVARRPDGSFPWSALVIWGALDGKLLQGVFSERDIAVPGDLSVVLLGHPGVATESNNFFTVIGSSAAETISALCELTLRRMADERAEFVTRYLEPVIAEGQSEVDTI